MVFFEICLIVGAMFGAGWSCFKLGKNKVKKDLLDNIATIKNFKEQNGLTTDELEDLQLEHEQFLKKHFS